MKAGGIYLHIPFCRSKCLYCDFYSGGSRIADWNVYIRSMINELQARESELNFHPVTLYIGGGTPSLIPPNNLEELISTISKKTGSGPWEELTLEVNPEDVSSELCHSWKNIGINRISIGIQSLNDDELKRIGRRHDALTAMKSIELVKEEFDNVSVDLMFGLPGQRVESYKKSLDGIISLQPSHLSAYSLMLESGTAMTLLEEKGKISLPDEDEWIEMFKITTEKFQSEGYRRYEISNYSLPGYESRHNSNYWNSSPYLGLGPGAHSYDGHKTRKANPKDIKGYIKFFNEKIKCENPFYIEEKLTDKEHQEEMIMTRLRTVKGLDMKEYEEYYGENKINILRHQASGFISRGFMEEESGFLYFTEKGFLIMNDILINLI